MVTAFKLPRHPEAFSLSPSRGKRRPRITDEQYLRWLRTLPCTLTGRRPVEAAHIRLANPIYGKRETGKSEKPSDRWALPLCADKHREQHGENERLFWLRHGVDPCQVAAALWASEMDDEAAEVILRAARETASTMVTR